MHIPIRSERQRRRALRMLVEIEAEHIAQCESIETCKLLRELREDIAELKGPPNNKKRFECRDFCRHFYSRVLERRSRRSAARRMVSVKLIDLSKIELAQATTGAATMLSPPSEAEWHTPNALFA